MVPAIKNDLIGTLRFTLIGLSGVYRRASVPNISLRNPGVLVVMPYQNTARNNIPLNLRLFVQQNVDHHRHFLPLDALDIIILPFLISLRINRIERNIQPLMQIIRY